MNLHIIFFKRRCILDYIVIFLELRGKYPPPAAKKKFVRTEVRRKKVTRKHKPLSGYFNSAVSSDIHEDHFSPSNNQMKGHD